MNLFSFTAFVITVHHLSAFISIICGLIFSFILFFLLKDKKNRGKISIIFLVLGFIATSLLCEKIFLKKALTLEVIRL